MRTQTSRSWNTVLFKCSKLSNTILFSLNFFYLITIAKHSPMILLFLLFVYRQSLLCFLKKTTFLIMKVALNYYYAKRLLLSRKTAWWVLQVSWDIINPKALLNKTRSCQQSYFLGKCGRFKEAPYLLSNSITQSLWWSMSESLCESDSHRDSHILHHTQSKVTSMENSRDK